MRTGPGGGGGVWKNRAERQGGEKPGGAGRAGSSGHLTSHPPGLLQLPGGHKHGDLSVSSIPEILHRHGDAPTREEVLEAVPVGQWKRRNSF